MCEKELDFALGYFTVFPGDLKNSSSSKEPFLYIREDCPEDIRERLLVEWERVKKETNERHKQGIYSSKDYF
ncbi:MAG: hypothetical protein Q4D13_04090 [Erysipelotrichaceae bacterium]|nr:hypothetical protein [Erysipelotrichaceae bacterium]